MEKGSEVVEHNGSNSLQVQEEQVGRVSLVAT